MSRAFGAPESASAEARWTWLFTQSSTEGTVRYLVADAGDCLAGQFAGVPVRLQHRGEVVRGLVAVDMATDPSYRKQGVFTALARQLYAESAEDAAVVFGFPNPTAAPIHYGYFDWVELRPFPLLIRPLGNFVNAMRAGGVKGASAGRLLDLLSKPLLAAERSIRLASRGSAQIQPLERFSDWADDLWAELAPDLGTCVVRDAAYLNWRFCASPYSYRRYALNRDGRTVGFAVTSSCPTRFGTLNYLVELMASKRDTKGARLLLAHVLSDAVGEGASAICTIATRRHPHRRAILQAGFFPAPRTLSADYSFGVRRNGAGVAPNELFHVDDWYLSDGDRDTI